MSLRLKTHLLVDKLQSDGKKKKNEGAAAEKLVP